MEKLWKNPWKMRIEAGNMGGFTQTWEDLVISAATEIWDLTNQKPVIS